MKGETAFEKDVDFAQQPHPWASNPRVADLSAAVQPLTSATVLGGLQAFIAQKKDTEMTYLALHTPHHSDGKQDPLDFLRASRSSQTSFKAHERALR